MPDKSLLWAGSSLQDLRVFPPDARREAGFQLRRVQQGWMPADFKPLSTVGHGTYEIRIHTTREHRVIYIAKFAEGIYVLHAFEKRTRRTRPVDLELARQRLAEVLRQRNSQ